MRSAVEALLVMLHPRLRPDLMERMGRTRPAVRPGSVWIHAASVGEAKAAMALGEVVQPPVFITCDTPEARDVVMTWALAAPGRYAGIRPVDTPSIVGGLWSLARPRALVWIESSWWPTLSSLSSHNSVPQFRASGSVGKGTQRRWRLMGPRPRLEGLYARDADSASAFEMAGEGPVLGIGDLKSCAPVARTRLRWDRPFVVAACTQPGDEAFVLAALGQSDPSLGLVLAPRDVDRCKEVAALLSHQNLSWIFWSDVKQGRVPVDTRVVLINRLGVLSGLYEGAQAAWIGATLSDRRGAHSPLEAQRAGIGILSGPHREPHASAFDNANAQTVSTPEALAAGWRDAAAPPPLHTTIPHTIAAHIARTQCDGGPTPRRPALKRVNSLWSSTVGRRTGPMWSPGVKTVAVGGASARGSGKTTLGRHLAASLAHQGFQVGVVARGFGRRWGRETRGSWTSKSGRYLGDDAALYARDGHFVASGPNRIASAEALIRRGVDVLLLEDGLQQKDVAADWRVAIVDTSDPDCGGGYPAGDLRERRLVPADCDATVSLNGTWPDAIPCRLSAGCWYRGDHKRAPEDLLAGFCGVGRAWRVQDLMHPHLGKFRTYADHTAFTTRQLNALRVWSGGSSWRVA